MRRTRHIALSARTLSTAAAWIAAVVVCLCVSEASAQQGPKPVKCRAEKAEVVCDLRLVTFFDGSIKNKMRSGLLNRFTYRIYIRRVKDGEPVALAAMRLVQVYELWDEVFFVVQQDGEDQTRKSQSLDQAIDHLANLKGLIVAQDLPPGRYYADLFVELNPMSKEEEAELRAWIARSRGGQNTFATGDRSFFGTFVSLFINIRSGKAERTLRIQTPPFEVAEP